MDESDVFARAMPPPVDVAVDGTYAGKLTPHLASELRGWVTLPLVALALAGFMALLLALSRVPGAEFLLPWVGQSFFQKGLVAHVTFAFVVWYMGVHGALTVLATAQCANKSEQEIGSFSVFIGRTAIYGAGLSLLMMLAPAVADLGEPSLNNYIPVLIHPLFYAGLALLALCLALLVVRLLATVARKREVEASAFGIAAAGVIYLISLVCVAAAVVTIPPNAGPVGTNEYVMWGGGHVLQFANTALMLCAFYMIARITLGETPIKESWFKAAMLVMVAGAAAGPLLYLTYQGGDPSQRMAFTYLYWFALPVPSAVILGHVASLLYKRRADLLHGAPEAIGTAVALALFAFGGIIGYFEGSVDTRTPSHYHAMLIAVTLGFIALYFALFLPLAGLRTPRRGLRLSMYLLLGGGQFLHSLGLYLAGLDGVVRKTAGAAQGLDSGWKVVTMSMMGLGGVIAVAGGVIFVVLAGRMLLARGGGDGTATSVSSV
jgi:cytochrome c oxidase subunit I